MSVDRLELELPVPPTLNQMIELAKKRTRRTRNGGWMKRALPIVYDQELELYEMRCMAAIREAGIRPPPEPWARWRLVSMHFRTGNTRDWLELAAGGKWAVDFLVRNGFLAGDSPREMERPEVWPTQEVDRANRGLEVVIERLPAPASPPRARRRAPRAGPLLRAAPARAPARPPR